MLVFSELTVSIGKQVTDSLMSRAVRECFLKTYAKKTRSTSTREKLEG